MNVLVDTCVWSGALRKSASSHSPQTQELLELIREGRAAMIGPVRQEILCGIRSEKQFQGLREKLWGFSDLPLSPEDYETAAEFFNRCRKKGVQGSNTDFLICAAALRHNLSIFTTDGDFHRYALHVPIRLHSVRFE